MTQPALPPAGIIYIEIPAPDLAKAEAFYREVFHWHLEPSPLGNYTMFTADKDGLGGGLTPSLKPTADAGPVLYLKVLDIPQTLQAIERAGGRSIKPKTDIGEHGFYAHFQDPNGNRMGLWSKS